MKYNIEKINEIGKLLVEVVEAAANQEGKEEIRIGDIEMVLRESLQAIGQSALKQFLEQADGEAEAEIKCSCGGKLKYQRRRKATIWSVFGKVGYRRAYYAGCVCGTGCAPVDRRYGIEPGQVTAGLAVLIALSGIKESFDEGRKWLKEYLLFEVSENTVRAETQKMGKLQLDADEELVKEMQDEKCLQKREHSQVAAPDILYGSVDAAKVRIEPRDPQEKAVKDRETWRDLRLVAGTKEKWCLPASSPCGRRTSNNAKALFCVRKTKSIFVILPRPKSLASYCGPRVVQSAQTVCAGWSLSAMVPYGSGI
jgi:hypothetical protein